MTVALQWGHHFLMNAHAGSNQTPQLILPGYGKQNGSACRLDAALPESNISSFLNWASSAFRLFG
jgi:hypothetical protein